MEWFSSYRSQGPGSVGFISCSTSCKYYLDGDFILLNFGQLPVGNVTDTLLTWQPWVGVMFKRIKDRLIPTRKWHAKAPRSHICKISKFLAERQLHTYTYSVLS